MTDHLTLTALARRWGITKQSCGLRVKEEDFPCQLADGKKTYPWPRVNDWWIERRVRQATNGKGPDELDRARIRKLQADAEVSEMERDQMRGELVQVDLFRRALLDAFGRVRTRLLTLPARGASILKGKSKVVQIRPALELLVREVIAELRAEAVPELQVDDEVVLADTEGGGA